MRRALIVVIAVLLSSLGLAQDNGARELLRLVNQERAKAGAPPLAWDEHLAQAAQGHAERMADKKELSHQLEGEPGLRERIAATGLRFNDDAENVAFDDSLEEAHDNLMHSPGHRANILNPAYNALGAAVVRRGQVLYVVEDFALKLPELSDAEVAQRVVAEFNRQRHAVGLEPVRVVGDLHADACQMAELDHVATSVIHAPRAIRFVAFTTFRPEDLPPSLVARVHEPELTNVAIGACFAKSASYSSGTNWVAVAFFPRTSR
jgi:uncharacterized protein YkwD